MRKSNEISLKEALANMVNALGMKQGIYQNKIEQIWGEKMGATISTHTKEIKLRKNKLYLTIDSSSLKQELTYSREKIAEMLNQALGDNYITDVIVR